MPFDSLDAPPEWGRGPGDDDAERPWSVRDRLVVAAIGLLLAAITLGDCAVLIGYWIGPSHDG